MDFIQTSIPQVLIIKPKIYEDQRGFFLETYQVDQFQEAGIVQSFIQDNHSGSKRGTLRGLHYQIVHPQGKLVRAITGEIFDVAVDLRRSSPTFGQWEGVFLSASNKWQLWIPPGFAHGFYVLSDWAEVLYKVTDIYLPQAERTLAWNDPHLNIQWPLSDQSHPILSIKDQNGLQFKQAECYD